MKIVRTSEMAWQLGIDHEPFVQRRKPLGGQRIGCGLWELPPGKKSFPFHSHHGTEEALFVISGQARLRTPEGLALLQAGDFVSFPPSGPAHQLINESAAPFVYVAMGASLGVDVVEYPDSGKVNSSYGVYPDLKRFIFHGKDQVDYWEGEK